MNRYAVVYNGHVQREFRRREDAWDYLVQRGWRWSDEAHVRPIRNEWFTGLQARGLAVECNAGFLIRGVDEA
jgi:hypothetical protein